MWRKSSSERSDSFGFANIDFTTEEPEKRRGLDVIALRSSPSAAVGWGGSGSEDYLLHQRAGSRLVEPRVMGVTFVELELVDATGDPLNALGDSSSTHTCTACQLRLGAGP